MFAIKHFQNCNFSSLLNHRLIQVTFFTSSCQICVQSDFMMVRLGPSVKNKVLYGERTHEITLPSLLSSFLRHCNCFKVLFRALKIRLKKSISTKKASKMNQLGDLRLQLSGTDAHLEFGTVLILFQFFLLSRTGNVIDWKSNKMQTRKHLQPL